MGTESSHPTTTGRRRINSEMVALSVATAYDSTRVMEKPMKKQHLPPCMMMK
jgi:hypothetical protein